MILKEQNNTVARFTSACQIIVISPLAKSKHLNNNKLLIWISSKIFSSLKSKITKMTTCNFLCKWITQNFLCKWITHIIVYEISTWLFNNSKTYITFNCGIWSSFETYHQRFYIFANSTLISSRFLSQKYTSLLSCFCETEIRMKFAINGKYYTYVTIIKR